LPSATGLRPAPIYLGVGYAILGVVSEDEALKMSVQICLGIAITPPCAK
jgi:hypothetical protein